LWLELRFLSGLLRADPDGPLPLFLQGPARQPRPGDDFPAKPHRTERRGQTDLATVLEPPRPPLTGGR
jgi:hypothetical protein